MKQLLKWNKKKLLLGGIAAILVAAIGMGIILGTGSGESVNVYPFEYIGMTEYWGDNQESYGPVTTDKIQTVFLSDTQTVTEILVKEGDTVKKGDILMTFDTSLDSIALERKSLEVEKLKLQLKDVQRELGEVQELKPSDPVMPWIPEEDVVDLGVELKTQYEISNQNAYDGSKDSLPLICWVHDLADVNDTLLEQLRLRAAELQKKHGSGNVPSSASAVPETTSVVEGTEEALAQEEPAPQTESREPKPSEEAKELELPEESKEPEPPEESKESEPPEESKESEPPEESQESESPEESKESESPEESKESEPPEESKESEPPEESKEPEPSEKPEDPVPSAPPATGVSDFYVVFKVTEKNMSKGARLVWQGLHVFGDKANGFTFKFFDASLVEDYTLPVEEETIIPDIDFGVSYTKKQLAQMRSELKKKIAELEFNIRMAEADYKIMQQELNDGHIYAQIDGQVVSQLPEEEARMANQPLIKVSGGGGFYIEGSVSELEKDKLKPGQEVTINDWNTGMIYTGEVRSVGDFPSQENNWNGMGNPNASYYPFRVFVGEEADLQAGRYVSITYSTSGAENGVYLENPFIRTENGQSYVYIMGVDGRLEKRQVTLGKSLWGSYKEILSGISETDLIAFPYGKHIKEGAPAVESDISALYEY